jgi:hypothetical protein
MLMMGMCWEVRQTPYRKNTGALIDMKEVGVQVHTEKLSLWCCLFTRMQGRLVTKIANISFENMGQLKYLGSTAIIIILSGRKENKIEFE